MHGNVLAQRIGLVFVLTGISTTAASAEIRERPFHVEASLGRATVDSIEGMVLDERTTAFRLGTGYRAIPWLGISAGYVNFSRFDANISVDMTSSVPLSASADGFEVTVSGYVPLTADISFTADLGNLWWSSDTMVDTLKTSDTGNDFTWGAGVEYSMNEAFAVTASWRRFTIDTTDVDTLWLGARVRFGDAD